MSRHRGLECTCRAPRHFLSESTLYGLPALPDELVEYILHLTRSDTRCSRCDRLLARSIESECRMHARTRIECIDCFRASGLNARGAGLASTYRQRRAHRQGLHAPIGL